MQLPCDHRVKACDREVFLQAESERSKRMRLFRRLMARSKGEFVRDKTQISPRLINSSYLTTLINNGLPENEMPYSDSFLADVAVTYTLGTEDSSSFLKARDVINLGVSTEELFQISIDNIHRRTEERFFLARHGLIKEVVAHSELTSCVVLLRNYWSELVRNYRSPLIVSIPNVNEVFFARANFPNEIEALCDARDLRCREEGAIIVTNHLFEFVNGDWTVFCS